MGVPSYLQLLSQIDVFGEEVISVIAVLQERQEDKEKIEQELTKALALAAAPASRKRKYRDIEEEEEEIISADNFKTITCDRRVHMVLINDLRRTILTHDIYTPKWLNPNTFEGDEYLILYRNAFKHSLMLYDSLQKKNKLSSTLTEAVPLLKHLQTDINIDGSEYRPNSEIENMLLYYFHDVTPDHIEISCIHAYKLLRVNRNPDGHVFFNGVDDMEMECYSGLDLPAFISHQYIILFNELQKKADTEKWTTRKDFCNIFNAGVDILIKKKLNWLDGIELHDCVEEIIESTEIERRRQQFDFCCFLIDNKLQEIRPDDEKLQEVKKKFPLVVDDYFNDKLNFVYPHGKKRASWELLEEKSEMERERYWNPLIFEPIRLKAHYYKFKLALACELGIIKLDEKGTFVDNPNVSEWKIL